MKEQKGPRLFVSLLLLAVVVASSALLGNRFLPYPKTLPFRAKSASRVVRPLSLFLKARAREDCFFPKPLAVVLTNSTLLKMGYLPSRQHLLFRLKALRAQYGRCRFSSRARAICILFSLMSHTFLRSRICLLYTSPSPRDATLSRMPSSA